MRHRLSATYTVWQKTIVTILLFVFFLITGIYGFILRSLPDVGFANYAVVTLFFFGCYKLVGFVFRERTILEFDNRCLYITSKKDSTQEVIPFEDILRLNMRGRHFDIGNYWFYKYTLSYLTPLKEERSVAFFMRMPSTSTEKFVALVIASQPGFSYKNWTHSFDLSD